MPYADAVRRIGASLVWVDGQTPAWMAAITVDLKVDALIGTASAADQPDRWMRDFDRLEIKNEVRPLIFKDSARTALGL